MEGYGPNDCGGGKLMTARGDTFSGAHLQPTQKATPAMGVSIQMLAQNIERLAMAVQNLQNKLEPVLYAEPPSQTTTTGMRGVEARAPRASSSLGDKINSFADQIETIGDLVNGMTRRCEL